jgi:esterase/lipase
VPQVAEAVEFALTQTDALSGRRFADLLHDDERIEHAWDRAAFSKSRHAAINDQEIATRNAEPFLLVPQDHRDIGVVLVHGFLASPAELRAFGQRVAAAGIPVVGVRLKGHGTSPWDLRERTWLDWLESVRRGYRLMSSLTSRVCLVGFSTGAALCLRLAADQPAGLAGVFAASVPYKFRNRNMVFVPIVHGANRLVRWVSSYEGVMPFRRNDSEHPDINYRNMPIRGLYELHRIVDELDNRLIDVDCPVQLVQGTEDPVVDPRSAELIEQKLGSKQVSLQMVEADRHGILSDDIGGAQQLALDFLEGLSQVPGHPAGAQPASGSSHRHTHTGQVST